MEIELTGMQRTALGRALAPFADEVDSVAVYGSRATGSARRGSDVDLVFYGSASPAYIRLALEESDLSIFADVVKYDEIDNLRLRAEIDRDALPLFRKADLTSFARENTSR
ncbi:MAG: nucleotidyltransferase domain-containing protein [Sphingomonadales bacterium]